MSRYLDPKADVVFKKIFGVIQYLAPEVLSKEPYTKESDIYSFGMLMWEHITDCTTMFSYQIF